MVPVARAFSLSATPPAPALEESRWFSRKCAGSAGQQVEQMKALTDKAGAEKRSLTAESKTWDDLEDARPRLRDSIDGIVRERLEYKTGSTKEKAYLLGDGAQKPSVSSCRTRTACPRAAT
jgi:hypothetical protein